MKKSIEQIQKELAETIEYKTRVWPWWNELAYIDARQAQDRLDQVVWIDNWKVEYAEYRWELFAWVSIRINWEWITKWDWWNESNIEKEKWAISDSFKRACVVWGLGRFLYNIKPIKSNNTKKTENKEIKWYNDVDKNIDMWIDMISDWKTTPQAIIDKIEAQWYTINKANKQKILNLW